MSPVDDLIPAVPVDRLKVWVLAPYLIQRMPILTIITIFTKHC